MHEDIMKVPRCNCAVLLQSKRDFIVYFADASDQVQTPAMAAPVYGTVQQHTVVGILCTKGADLMAITSIPYPNLSSMMLSSHHYSRTGNLSVL
jgi:hypothetical protein